MTVTAHYIVGKRDAQQYRPATHEPHWSQQEKRDYDRGYASV
jgi:hypothetical protein